MRRLLAEIEAAHDPEVLARARGLQGEIDERLSRLERARAAAEAHAALGGTEETDAVVEEVEAELDPLLAELRSLHAAELGAAPADDGEALREAARDAQALKAAVKGSA